VGELSGNREKDYRLLAGKVVENLERYDGLYVHIKGPDVPAHDGDFEEKVKVIEDIDSHFFGNLVPRLDVEGTLFVITADHSTSCLLRAHSSHPVPVVLSGGGLAPDGTGSFGERECAGGELGELVGTSLMPLVMEKARSS